MRRDFSIKDGPVKRLVKKWQKHYMYRRWLADEIQELILAERYRCADIARRFTVKPDCRVHPDIPFKDMNEGAQTAAHMTAQQIALKIMGEA